MTKTDNEEVLASSFRDPSGFVFFREGEIYRQVNEVYRANYDLLIESGLYRNLVDAGLLIPHTEVELPTPWADSRYKVIRPEPIPFISYPYEWCFSQLKDAAVTTLEIQKRALDFGMSLKDASAYNIQFRGGKPVLIDTLSFEKLRPGEPWVAYRQFCQHFLGPLALMSFRDVRLNQLLRVHIDGIPLDLASRLLPLKTRLRMSLLLHIHIHARSQAFYADKQIDKTRTAGKVGQKAILGLVDNLESAVRKLNWRVGRTEWGDYYVDTNYSPVALKHKRELVARFLDELRPRVVWDLGANVGLFSRIASERGILTIASDIDPAAVEKNYLECSRKGEPNLLPLLLDLTNPSPDIGWQNRERTSFFKRGPADTVLALALVHHLAISNNIPLGQLADFFRNLGNSFIIEFIPKTDSQVQRLLATREDIFNDYKQAAFEREFTERFTILNFIQIEDSERILYLMKKRTS